MVVKGKLSATLETRVARSRWTKNAKSVVLKVVDIDAQGSIGPSKDSINSHGVEWASLNGQGARP